MLALGQIPPMLVLFGSCEKHNDSRGCRKTHLLLCQTLCFARFIKIQNKKIEVN